MSVVIRQDVVWRLETVTMLPEGREILFLKSDYGTIVLSSFLSGVSQEVMMKDIRQLESRGESTGRIGDKTQ